MNAPAPISRQERAAFQREFRKGAIFSAALELAGEVGFRDMKREEIAERAGAAVGSINFYFGTMDALRDAVVLHAIEHEELLIVAQAVASNHPLAAGISSRLKISALRNLVAQ